MKKFRIVALLLVMCLASSCFVGGTFAKYSSTAEGSDSAVVARWSINVDGTDIAVEDTVAFDLFATVKGYHETTPADDAGADTDLKYTDGYIAPGTQGVAGFVITNNSEVDINYSITFTITNANAIPLEFQTSETTWTSWANLDDDDDGIVVMTVSEDTLLWDAVSAQENLEWRWAFGGDDTALGKAAFAADQASTARPFVTVVADISAEQNN